MIRLGGSRIIIGRLYEDAGLGRSLQYQSEENSEELHFYGVDVAFKGAAKRVCTPE